MTADGRFMFANRRAHRLLGVDDGALLGERVDRFHDDPEPGGADAEHEAIVRRADGSRIWVVVTTAAVLYQGKDARITGLLDITDRKRAEAQLRDNERRFRDFASSSGDWLWEMDAELRYCYFSENVERLAGMPVQWLLGKTRRDLLAPDHDRTAWDAHFAVLEARQPFRDFVYRATADGVDIRWLRISGVPVFDDQRRFVGYRGVSTDITELKRAEEQLRESEQRFRDFAASSSDWLWEMGPDLRFTYMSPNIERIVGMPAAWHMGKSRRELLGVNYDQGQWHDHLAAVEAHQPFRDFVYCRAANTSDPRWIRISGVPIFDGHGNFRGYRGVGTDITEQHELQAQLVRAQKLDSVGQLTGGVAHDFNNILGIIIGNLDLLRQQLREGTEHEQQLQRAIKAGERGGTLTQRLLAFSRRQPLYAKALEVPALLDETGDLLRRTFGPSHPLEIDLPVGLWPAHADAAQLESAIVNLAINARDASPTGARIAVRARNLPAAEAACLAGVDLAPGDYVALVVIDRGAGMSPAVLERCCEPFFTTKEVGRGAGLGLSMIMGFAKQSGGDLLIESDVGVGTTVTLMLPRAPAPALAKTG